MSLDKLFQFVGERAHSMMLLLRSDICGDLNDIRFGNRERAVASGPRKFSPQEIARVDPVR